MRGQSKVSERAAEEGKGLFKGLVDTEEEALLSKYPQHLIASLTVRLVPHNTKHQPTLSVNISLM